MSFEHSAGPALRAGPDQGSFLRPEGGYFFPSYTHACLGAVFIMDSKIFLKNFYGDKRNLLPAPFPEDQPLIGQSPQARSLPDPYLIAM